MSDRLRELWDFADLVATERRFRTRLEDSRDRTEQAEIVTQLGRVFGLRGDFAAGHRLIDEAEVLAEPGSAAYVRVLLERGRLHRSSGSPVDAQPLFVAAFELAKSRGDAFLAVDAAHMVALVDDIEQWTRVGLEIAQGSADPQVRRWMGPLLNNLGWHQYEAGKHSQALETFESALAAREEVSNEATEIEIARYAVAKTLRALGRPAKAAELMEQAVAASEPDGWFHEELAEDYFALGRLTEAASHARRAMELLTDPDPGQTERLKELAGSSTR